MKDFKIINVNNEKWKCYNVGQNKSLFHHTICGGFCGKDNPICYFCDVKIQESILKNE